MSTRLPLLVARLRSALPGRAGRELRTLPGDQLIVRCAMKPNPAAGAGLKAAAEIPSEQGYEIYVSCQRPAAAQGGQAVSARMQPPAVPFPPDGRLACTAGTPSASWDFLNADGELVSVRARLGPRAPHEEVDAIFAAIETLLLR